VKIKTKIVSCYTAGYKPVKRRSMVPFSIHWLNVSAYNISYNCKTRFTEPAPGNFYHDWLVVFLWVSISNSI